MKRTPLARKNLVEKPSRTVVSALGVGFAIVLMFMQLGFMGAVGDTATKVYLRTGGDVIVRSPEYLQAFDPRSIPSDALTALESLVEVEGIRPLDLGITRWQNPQTGDLRVIAMMGIDCDRPALRIDELATAAPLLRRPDVVLVDDATRADYGPADGRQFGEQDIGVEAEVTGRRVLIGGTFRMGTGLAANGAILVSRQAFRRLAPDRITLPSDRDRISMLVIDSKPDVAPESTVIAIRDRLAKLGGEYASLDVMTLEQAMSAERYHWYVRTPIGVIFAMGVALAFIVGSVICYMVLAADVIAKLPEYATLKALGYPNSYLIRVLLGQAAWLAGAALPPAVLASLALYWITSLYSGVAIQMTSQRLVFVSVLAFVMCGMAGWVALRKMTKAEPANLF